MKKHLIRTSIIVFFIGLLLLPTISNSCMGKIPVRVISPSFGELWYKGESYKVKWSCDLCWGNDTTWDVYVEIFPHRGGYEKRLIAEGVPNYYGGNYTWTIPLNLTDSFDHRYLFQMEGSDCPDCTNVPKENQHPFFIIDPSQRPSQNDTYWLAKALTSEASTGTQTEKIAVAYCIINRYHKGGFGDSIQDVVKNDFAYDLEPNENCTRLSTQILIGAWSDYSNGSFYFFSPMRMPQKGDDTTGIDIAGGLHTVPGTNEEAYFPGWAKPSQEIDNTTTYYQTTTQLQWKELNNIRNWFFMFYQPFKSNNHTGETPRNNNETNSSNNTGNLKETPGFEILITAGALAFIVFWKRKRLANN